MSKIKYTRVIAAAAVVALGAGCANDGTAPGEGFGIGDALIGAVLVGGVVLAEKEVEKEKERQRKIERREREEEEFEAEWQSHAERDNSPQFRKHIKTVTPSSISLCPKHIAGDREFGGNGPDVKASAVIVNGLGRMTRSGVRKNYVAIEVSFEVKETKSNWSEARGREKIILSYAPVGGSVRVLSDRGSTWSYEDVNHSADTKYLASTELVKRFEAKGDTGGNDIGNCTGDDSYLKVEFNPVRLEISAPIRS